MHESVIAIAATGMNAQEQNIEVIANNIANINTTGFKRARAEFTDLLYQNERLMGVASRGRDATIPEGAQIGLGVRTAAIRTVHIQGALTQTSNTLDWAINGRGWFQVTTPNGDLVYTRDGAFNTNATGQVVTTDGYAVTPAVTIPTNATNVVISQTGVVTRDDTWGRRPRHNRLAKSPSRISSTTRAFCRSATISIRRPRPPARRPSACPAIRPSARSSKAILRRRTSIRSPRSPISSPRSAPMR